MRGSSSEHCVCGAAKGWAEATGSFADTMIMLEE
jgi:hypothetical protein